MEQKEILKYYSDEKLQRILWELARDREFACRDAEGIYFKRPNMLHYPKDIISKVIEGAVSFHLSVERWKNVMDLENAKEKDYQELRKGWDWIIDIDSGRGLEFAKVTAVKVIDFLKGYGIKTYTIKFSGRRGFHIGISFENFPKEINFKKIELWYPELPRILSSFLREQIKEELLAEFSKLAGSVKALIEGLEISELSPYEFVEIEKDWGPRHLFRAPYSLHEKTYLVSIPLEEKEIKEFKEDFAKPENTKINRGFLDKAEENCMNELILDALHWWRNLEKEYFRLEMGKEIKRLDREIKKLEAELKEKDGEYNEAFLKRDKEEMEKIEADKKRIKQTLTWLKERKREKEIMMKKYAITKTEKVSTMPAFAPYFKSNVKVKEESFAPCIKKILGGIEDGRKRSCFTLITYLRLCKWSWEEIEEKLMEWGKKVGLKEGILKSQLKWHKKQKPLLPANCSNDLFYKDIGICEPDEICKKIKNPINYHLFLLKNLKQDAGKKSKKRSRKKAKH